MTAALASQQRINSLFDDASYWPKRPRCEKLWRRLFLCLSKIYSKRQGYTGYAAYSFNSSYSSCIKVSLPFIFNFITLKLNYIGP
jgi:hypothetical protein